jgi:hypothetical protein
VVVRGVAVDGGALDDVDVDGVGEGGEDGEDEESGEREGKHERERRERKKAGVDACHR